MPDAVSAYISDMNENMRGRLETRPIDRDSFYPKGWPYVNCYHFVHQLLPAEESVNPPKNPVDPVCCPETKHNPNNKEVGESLVIAENMINRQNPA